MSGVDIQDAVFGELRVIGAEGLIGFKLQGWVNDPDRTQDLEDIRALLRTNRSVNGCHRSIVPGLATAKNLRERAPVAAVTR